MSRFYICEKSSEKQTQYHTAVLCLTKSKYGSVHAWRPGTWIAASMLSESSYICRVYRWIYQGLRLSRWRTLTAFDNWFAQCANGLYFFVRVTYLIEKSGSLDQWSSLQPVEGAVYRLMGYYWELLDERCFQVNEDPKSSVHLNWDIELLLRAVRWKVLWTERGSSKQFQLVTRTTRWKVLSKHEPLKSLRSKTTGS